MILKYYDEEVNFWDALNPYIFNNLLPWFFDKEDGIDFFWIGSIIGFDFMKKSKAKRKIIFSSGIAYASPPIIDESYDIFCVRWPLTAKKMWLDPKIAICDGAILIREVYKKNVAKYDCSFMPHHRSAKLFDWQKICDAIWLKYLNPCWDIMENLKAISESKLIITEAMHGAIVSDALRVPWIPIKIYWHFNEFKWKDWMYSLDMKNDFISVPRMYREDALLQKLNKQMLTSLLRQGHKELLMSGFLRCQNQVTYPSAIKILEDLKKGSWFLSSDRALFGRAKQLTEKLQILQGKYMHTVGGWYWI